MLLYLVRENTALLAPMSPKSSASNREKSFLDCAREYFDTDVFALDAIAALNEIGFSITPVAEQKAAYWEEVALAMDSLWKEFRDRHGEDLAASGVFVQLPKFLAG